MSIALSIRKLGKETAIYGIPQILSRCIAVFLVPLYTRLFTPAEYGLFGTITSLTQLLAMFAVLGLDNASGRWFYDTEDQDRRKSVMASWFWCQMAASLVLAGLFILMADKLSQWLFGSAEHAILLRIAVLAIPLMVFSRVLGNWMRYQRRPWLNVIYSMSISLGFVIFAILFVLVLKRGLLGLYQGQIIAYALSALAAVIIFHSWIKPSQFSGKLLKEMLIFAIPLIPAGIASWVTSSLDRILLPYFKGATENGIYYAGVQVTRSLSLITGAFQMAWGPFAFSIVKDPSAPGVYAKVFSLFCFFGCWLCMGLSLFSQVVLAIFTPSQYHSAASCIPYLAYGTLATTSLYIGVIGPSIEKKSMPIAKSIFVGAALNIGLNLVLIPLWGKDGAAISTLLAYGSASVYLFHIAQRLHHIPYQFHHALICLAVSGSFIAIDRLFLPPWAPESFAIRAIMCLAYLPLALLMGIVRLEQLRSIPKAISQRLRGAPPRPGG